MRDKLTEITKLTNLWYEYVSGDHHKDRDCHWSINTEWSYGESPTYVVRHYGYVYNKEVEIYCTSYKGAQNALISELYKAFKGEREWGERVLKNKSEWDKLQIAQAEKALKLPKKETL